MADITTTLAGIAEAIALNTDIKSLCTTHYSRAHTVFEGIDSRDIPGEQACPFVILSPVQKQGGLGISGDPAKKQADIGMACVVYDEQSETTQSGVVRFLGIARVERIRRLACDALVAALPPELKPHTLTTGYDPIEQFPYMSADVTITLTEAWVSGSSPFE